ncbi:MAG: hypothetical protein HY698_09780 [Deltaproteobacteria bacterium]|nr:hypothetical protein [Deltaproteobacteria bacterium]
MTAMHYEVLARLLAYPGPEFEAEVEHAVQHFSALCPRAAQALGEFQALMPKGDLVALRELYTRTFDVQAITSLDIGYTLFGEDYKRGALLANLSGEHARCGNECGVDLADHLTNVLRLLPKMTDAALREELVSVLVAPALQEMIREFEPARLVKKEALYKKHHKTIIESASGEARTAYRHALEAVLEVLRKEFVLKISLPIDQESRFAGSIGAELGIEDSGPCTEQPRQSMRGA